MSLVLSTVRFAVTALLLLGLWTVLVGSVAPQELGLGSLVAVALAVLVLRGAGPVERCLIHPRRLLHLVVLAPRLLLAIMRSTADVAWRTLQPRVAIRPGIVRARTRLESPLGRLALTSCITLTPGTLSVETEGDELFIHWIDVESPDIEATTRAIVASFEQHLEVVFG